MQSLYEDEVMRVDYDDQSSELVVVAKQSDQEDTILYITAHADGHLNLVAPMCRWHPGLVDGNEGFRLWLN